jgi:ATP synthase protein I
MTERDNPKPEASFEERLRRAKVEADAVTGRDRVPKTTSGIGFAVRLGVEIVSALVIGSLIGLLLDRWLGTTPWLMLLFFLLGAAAGFMNVYRTATGMNQTVGYASEKAKQDPKDGRAGNGKDDTPRS